MFAFSYLRAIFSNHIDAVFMYIQNLFDQMIIECSTTGAPFAGIEIFFKTILNKCMRNRMNTVITTISICLDCDYDG